jgi:NAD(P)-dependent dehydrogenase (short-subunit alcohol dehydrogenase family)
MPRLPALPDHGCAWVSGASSGIGAALVAKLVDAGWRVGATARDRNALAKLVALSPQRIVAVPADVSDKEAMAEAAAALRQAFGPIGLVVTNAGVYLPVNAPTIDPELYRKTFEVNLMGAVHMIAQTVPDMAARGQGHIHFVSSATGFGGMPTSSAYGASKAALINMAECLKIELERHHVGVSLSTPGFVDTPAQTDNAFPKPFMISADRAASKILEAVRRGGFETSFPRRFTWMLKALYALPKPVYLPLVRKQTGWDKPGGA